MKKLLKVFIGLICLSTIVYADLKEITPQKLEEAINKGVSVIDIRRVDEWNSTGIIPSSHKLTFFDKMGKYDVEDWLGKFEKIVKNKKQPFILVCRSANRTGIVGNFLNDKLGYENIYHLKGGIKNWMAQNRKTVK
jgi:rhodanese-related sulfurtransferase